MRKTLSKRQLAERATQTEMNFAPAPYITEMIEDRRKASKPLRPSDLRVLAMVTHSRSTTR